MLVSRLIHRFRLMHPDADIGGTGAPPAASPAPAAEPAPAPAAAAPAADSGAAPAAAPVDPFAGLKGALDAVGAEPAATPAPPAQPGQPRDPNGRFASATPAAPAPAQAPAAQAPAAGPTPAPKPGEIDLTPPEGMTSRAQERWSQLTERARMVPQLEQRATTAETQLSSVRQLVNESGLAPQEFTQMLEMSRLSKSANPQEAQRALQMLDGMRTQLATRLGVEVPGVDALASHPDLKQKVDGMLMTREDALEIARLRQQGQQAQTHLQSITNEQREIQQHQHAVQQASTRMNAALQARAGTPGHEAKMAYIAQHFANPQNMQAFVRTYQPHQWEHVVTTMYDAFTPQAPAPMPPQPLRPGNVHPGAPVVSGPVTVKSAVDAAFAAAGL